MPRHQEDDVRVGVIGCGYWGPQLIRNFATAPGAVLAAVADQRDDRLAYVAQNYPHAQRFRDHRDLLASDSVDAVVVCTPIHTHHEIARDALDSGRHVLVEKPLAASVREGAQLVHIARMRGLTLMAGHTFVYNPAVNELRRLVQEGELGKVFYADGARLNLGLFQRHLNVAWDLAPHDISILLHVFDQHPVEVAARGSAFIQPAIHDVVYLDLIFPLGIEARIHVSWLDPDKVRRMTVVGDRRMVVYDDVSLTEKIRIYDKGVEMPMTDSFGEFQLSYRYGDIRVPYVEWREPLRIEVEHFLHCMRTGEAPISDGGQGLAVTAVLEAADRSLSNGGRLEPVEISELPLSAPVLQRIGAAGAAARREEAS
jgi:predicted dehydrogenase